MRKGGATNAKVLGIYHDCLNKKVITLVKYQALEEAKLEEKGSDKEVHLMEMEEECIEEADEGEVLVLERALSGYKVLIQEEQRENIFHN